MPSALARVRTTSMFCGWQFSETKKTFRSVFERVAHRHRFGGGGGFVEQRGVGDVERGQIGDHRLEIQQRFEAALGNFGLIRRVLRVPAGIFQNIALDDRRRDAIVIAHADERTENLVLRRRFPSARPGLRVRFWPRADWSCPAQADVLRHGGGNQFVESFETDLREHFARFGCVRADMAADKGIGRR